MIILDFFTDKNLPYGKSISGKKRLKTVRIDTNQSLYELAFKKIKEMFKKWEEALWLFWIIILKFHSPKLSQTYKDALAPSIADTIKPPFERLGNESFYQAVKIKKPKI